MVVRKENPVISPCKREHLQKIASTQRELYGLNFKNIDFVNSVYIRSIVGMYEESLDDGYFTSSSVLLDGDKVVGYYLSSLRINFHMQAAKAYLDQIFISEEYRNMGYGKILLEHFEDSAKEKGMSVFELEVSSINESAVEFYKRNGYEISKTRGDHDEERHFMVKKG